jgi:membrane-associated phospholipid phosphatase
MRIRLRILSIGFTAIALFGAVRPATGQDQQPATPESKDKAESESGTMKIKPGHDTPPMDDWQKRRNSQILADFAQDQKAIWTSPMQIRFPDAGWLVPTAGLTAGLFLTDAQYSRHLSNNPSTLQHYSTLSNVGIGGLVGGAAAMWVLSHHTHNEHWRETGFLAGEAAIHSLIISESLKYTLRRDRPNQGDGSGGFFQGGTSFPSEHAAAAWSIASVIAHEYPGPLTKVLVYGAASMISFSRVHSKNHFPSDVVVGSLIGELSAHQIFKSHHDQELDGDEWDTWSDRARERRRNLQPQILVRLMFR